jgi:diadenosine tetraphosphate (Ap4A) HIT family hydrolase
MAEIARLNHRLSHALAKAFPLTGLNIFQNNGISAGQTIPHIHVHLVPRYTTSEAGKIFRERDYRPTAMEERERIAEIIRDELGEID